MCIAFQRRMGQTRRCRSRWHASAAESSTNHIVLLLVPSPAAFDAPVHCILMSCLHCLLASVRQPGRAHNACLFTSFVHTPCPPSTTTKLRDKLLLSPRNLMPIDCSQIVMKLRLFVDGRPACRFFSRTRNKFHHPVQQ